MVEIKETEENNFNENEKTRQNENLKKKDKELQEPTVVRARMPKKNEVIGIIEQRLGGNKMMVLCLDEKKRNCRVPGRFKRELWLREGDVVLIEPWEFDNNKGDIIFKYPNNQVEWLKQKGYISKEKNDF
ncbi:MAG: translation initiation factor eIF-1A [Candidatus Pacearchaeota archaeon]